MTAETDLIKLYSTRILALAAEMPRTGRLDAPDGTGRVRSPLCGSTVTVDIATQDGRITAYAQDVKACALGQAAAGVVGAGIVGCTRDEVARGRAELKAMLTEGAPPPAAPFEGLEVLRPAAEYRNRHASILLAFDATLAAFDALPARDCA
ncbi:MAG: iron-sulfur cluster assembly scaffold protein [Shimia sp.]